MILLRNCGTSFAKLAITWSMPRNATTKPRSPANKTPALSPSRRPTTLVVPIDVAVPVQTAAKSNALGRIDVEIDVDLTEPRLQRSWTRDASEKAASSRHQSDWTAGR
jgi:hypothetical protein